MHCDLHTLDMYSITWCILCTVCCVCMVWCICVYGIHTYIRTYVCMIYVCMVHIACVRYTYMWQYFPLWALPDGILSTVLCIPPCLCVYIVCQQCATHGVMYSRTSGSQWSRVSPWPSNVAIADPSAVVSHSHVWRSDVVGYMHMPNHAQWLQFVGVCACVCASRSVCVCVCLCAWVRVTSEFTPDFVFS